MKIKLIEVTPREHCYECGGNEAYGVGVTDWEEYPDDKMWELESAVRLYNSKRKDYYLVIARQTNRITPGILIKQWLEQQKKNEEAAAREKEKQAKLHAEQQKKALAKKAAKLKKQYEEAVAAGVIKPNA